MQEYEVKFLNVDPEDIQTKLAGIGAVKVGEYFYRRRVFDYPDLRLNKAHAWLRLRDEEEKITLTYKRRLGAISNDGSTIDDGMEEVEIVVNDFDKTAELLLCLGFIEKHFAENKRIRWQKDGIEFDIDTYPELEPYLEIESSDWEKVEEGIRVLGLNPVEKKIFSTNQVYALKGIKVSEYDQLKFSGLVKKSV